MKQKVKGKFITVEGIDGAGKTALVSTVVSTIRSAGISIVTTREPGGTSLGEQLRKLILTPGTEFCADAEILTIFAARAQHLHQLILPELRTGKWVLCDRFTDSTYAYQGGGRHCDHERIGAIEQWTQGDFRPDLTLLLDAAAETGQSRLHGGNGPLDRFELEEMDFHERVRETFRDIARREPDRVKMIDANLTESEVSEIARELMDEFLVANHG
ncbi:MAG: dTMP kinase [Acidiferrobacterales bacterium]|nr:dTMP kinase [Acidiferrobacterales bacterium]